MKPQTPLRPSRSTEVCGDPGHSETPKTPDIPETPRFLRPHESMAPVVFRNRLKSFPQIPRVSDRLHATFTNLTTRIEQRISLLLDRLPSFFNLKSYPYTSYIVSYLDTLFEIYYTECICNTVFSAVSGIM